MDAPWWPARGGTPRYGAIKKGGDTMRDGSLDRQWWSFWPSSAVKRLPFPGRNHLVRRCSTRRNPIELEGVVQEFQVSPSPALVSIILAVKQQGRQHPALEALEGGAAPSALGPRGRLVEQERLKPGDELKTHGPSRFAQAVHQAGSWSREQDPKLQGTDNRFLVSQ